MKKRLFFIIMLLIATLNIQAENVAKDSIIMNKIIYGLFEQKNNLKPQILISLVNNKTTSNFAFLVFKSKKDIRTFCKDLELMRNQFDSLKNKNITSDYEIKYNGQKQTVSVQKLDGSFIVSEIKPYFFCGLGKETELKLYLSYPVYNKDTKNFMNTYITFKCDDDVNRFISFINKHYNFLPENEYENWETSLHKGDELTGEASYYSYQFSDGNGNAFIFWSNDEKNFRLLSKTSFDTYYVNGNCMTQPIMIGLYDINGNLTEKYEVYLGLSHKTSLKQAECGEYIRALKSGKKIIEYIKNGTGYIRVAAQLFGLNGYNYNLIVPCMKTNYKDIHIK